MNRNTHGDVFEPSEDAYDWDAHLDQRADLRTETRDIPRESARCELTAETDAGPVAAAAYIAMAIVAAALTALLIGLYYAPLWIVHFALTVLAALTARWVERWIRGEQ